MVLDTLLTFALVAFDVITLHFNVPLLNDATPASDAMVFKVFCVMVACVCTPEPSDNTLYTGLLKSPLALSKATSYSTWSCVVLALHLNCTLGPVDGANV